MVPSRVPFTRSLRWVSCLAALAAAVVSGCHVEVAEDALYSCATDADCGGDGFVCTAREGQSAFCCQPADETCDGRDNDCDGEVDDGIPVRACYTGPAGTQGVGACRGGEQVCQSGGFDATCPGEVVPVAEVCNNGVDDDCDGQVDEAPDGANATETCNGLDDDCDGEADEGVSARACYTGPAGTEGVGRCVGGQQVCQAGTFVETCAGEVLPGAEVCNTVDDDCDGQVDEDFDLTTSVEHCGSCANACGATAQCIGGMCRSSTESACDDMLDEDQDGLFDCADADCDGRSCATGCTCAGAVKQETLCSDGVDNDGDQNADCADSDCLGESCSAAAPTQTCDATLSCSCFGSATPPAETTCDDGVDNDCDGVIDCADSSCDTLSCGTGCVCANSAQKEIACGDFVDNDGDAQTDCADATDCPAGTPCQFMQGANAKPGTCQGNKQCK